jgi:streptogramin lyase
MRHALIAAAIIVSGTASAFAADTVNSYTPAQEAKAKAALTRAGYTPGILTQAQDGNLWFDATKGGQTYTALVTSKGEVDISGQ